MFDEHECEYMRTGEIRPDAEGDWVVASCGICGSEVLFEATAEAEDYAAAAEFAAVALDELHELAMSA